MKLMLIATIFYFFSLTPTLAMSFSVNVPEQNHLYEKAIHVELEGPIVLGDADRLRSLLLRSIDPDVREIWFSFDSPGGNLSEGMMIGEVISSIGAVTVSQVGTSEKPFAICASACVLAYLGSDFRHLSETGKIGVHQFNIPGLEISGSKALSMSQEISASILDYIVAQRASSEFFERMSQTKANDIDWVPANLLRQWKVVTGHVYDEFSEYVNVEGRIALRLTQISYYGKNDITLWCSRGNINALAVLAEPSAARVDLLEVVINGQGHVVRNYEVVKRENFQTWIMFKVPESRKADLETAKTFGARIALPEERVAYGFEQVIFDGKLREIAANCHVAPSQSSTVSRPPLSFPSLMTVYPGRDFLRADLTSSGVRGISFEECQVLCMQYQQCKAISYVVKKRWCWPKSSGERWRSDSGVLGAKKN